MPFISEILKHKSLSIVGLEKNTGKTECLNYIIDRLPFDKREVCITSIGIDGEKIDQVTSTHKPEIYLKKGCYFSTSEKHYKNRELLSELLYISDENTPLGRLVIAKALSPGKVILSGPSSSPSLYRIMQKTRSMGAKLNIIDGALSRLSSASPVISEAMILSTGAAFSANINTLIQKTSYIVKLISLPEYQCSLDENYIKISSLLQAAQVLELLEDKRVILLNGALTDNFIKKILTTKNVEGLEIRVKDFTKIFISPENYYAYIKRGGLIKVEKKSKLLAVCVNPVAPNGYILNSELLCEGLATEIGLPVYDIKKNKYEA